MGLTSGSARWLMSRATSHAAAMGLRLSGKHRARGWTRVGPGPLFMSGSSWSWNLAKARSLPGGTWGLPEGPGMSPWELRTHSYRGPVEVRTYQYTPGSLIFPCHVVLLALPHVVGLGAAPRVTKGCRTGAASSYCRRGCPCLEVPTIIIKMEFNSNKTNEA
jgi:hypothetical protein